MSDVVGLGHTELLEQAQARAIMELADKLLVVGDAHAFGVEVGPRAAGEAMHFLVERAPEEIQPSWPLVIAWHRMGQAYKTAAALGDSDGMVKAAREQSKIVTERY